MAKNPATKATAQTEAPKAEGPRKPPLIDRLDAPETYGDDIAGVLFNNGNFVITLAATRANDEQPPRLSRVTTGRFVIPVAAALDLLAKLSQVTNHLEAQGILARNPADPKTAG